MPGLTFGGAERVIFILCNELDREKFKPVLVLFNKKGMPLQLLKNDVEIIDLKVNRIRFSIFPVLKLIYKNKPEMIFGGWGEVSALLSPLIKLFPKTKFIARETNVVSEHVKRKEIRFFYNFYNNFHAIIAQSDDMKNDLIDHIGINPEKIEKINNPVDFDLIASKLISAESVYDNSFKNVVAIGNLSSRKGFDLLLNVFQHLKNEKIKLHIIGDGNEKEEFMKLKEDLQLENVSFLGVKENPFPYLHQADLFVLSSRYEGFPNVLLEAGACGTYALANDCPGGIREIVQEKINGEISDINDSEKFAQKISELVHELHSEEKIKNSIHSRFDKRVILAKYNQILGKL